MGGARVSTNGVNNATNGGPLAHGHDAICY